MAAKLKERISTLDPIIRNLRSICGSPSISIGISYDGQAIHRANYGYRDAEAQLPTLSNTTYAIGTLAKTFTASAIGILVSDCKINWDTPIKDVIPEFQSVDSTVTTQLTIVDLLCHHSGLARSNFWWMGSDGQLLIQKDKLISTYNTLEPISSIRSDWAYSNWGYAMIGEVIERVSGLPYCEFMEERLFKPLGLTNTTARKSHVSNTRNFAKPYAVLADSSLYPLPQPQIHDDSIMVPASGLYSTPDDLLTYSMALLASLETENGKSGSTTAPAPQVLRYINTQISGHAIISGSLTEKSYALGFYHVQLPNTVAGMGCNAYHVKKMPTIVPGNHSTTLISHGGSVPGYCSALALLPKLNASIVVCTNSNSLGDASAWITMALIEALTDTTSPTDFERYAAEAAQNHANSVTSCMKQLELVRNPDTLCRSLIEFTGTYADVLRHWVIVIRKKNGEEGLQVLFQGLESQKWTLSHYEYDTFLWIASYDEQAKRGHNTTTIQADSFKLIFGSEGGKINRLYWPHEPSLDIEKQCFMRILDGN